MDLDTYGVNTVDILQHRRTRGLGVRTEVQYLTRWENVRKPRWEHDEDLEQYGRAVLRYWLGDPEQWFGDNEKYRKYRVNVARRAEARRRGEMFVAKGYKTLCQEIEGPDCMTPNCWFVYLL